MSAAKECKYGCGTLISWDTATNSFKEADGTAHSKERCAYVKSLKPAATPAPNGVKGDYVELVAAIKELAAAIREGRA